MREDGAGLEREGNEPVLSVEIRSHSASDGPLMAHRSVLQETKQDGRWTTVATAIRDGDLSWLWTDVEHVRADAFGPPVGVAPPRFIAQFLDKATCRCGPLRLERKFVTVAAEDVEKLVALLHDPQRVSPVVVTTRNAKETVGIADARGRRLAHSLAGVAQVFALRDGAVSTFSELTGGSESNIHVWGGAVRTYLPGMDVSNPQPWRHIYIPYGRLRHNEGDAAQIVGRALLRSATLQEPPAVYMERVRYLPGFPASAGQDAESLLADLIRAEERVDELTRDFRDTQDERDLAQLEVEEATDQLEKAAARIRQLETASIKRGEFLEDTVSEEIAPPDGCADALKLGSELDGLVVPEKCYGDAAKLDANSGSSKWARKAWRTFRAMERYVAAVRLGQANSENFREFARSGDTSADAIPLTWVELAESETTRNNERMRQARTFEVDERVSADGRQFMEAHIKLDQGGPVAPRIYFFDDTRGVTGSIHVGYFGSHLPNKSTN